MPTAENPDGTLWIDIRNSSEVEAIRRWLTELNVPVTALVADPACEALVEEVAWADLYPKIVPRNGPEPGVIVRPAEIPSGHTLLLAVNAIDGAPNNREVVVMLRLIRGPAPTCYGKVLTRAQPPAKDPRLRPVRPLGPAAGGRAGQSQNRSQLMLRTDRADQQTQDQLWVLGERLADPLRVESRSWEFWVSYPDGFAEPDVRDQVLAAIEPAGLHLIAID